MLKKKLILLSLILFLCLGVSGCKNDNAVILLNHQPITKETILNNSKVFVVGRRIYYILLVKKPLTTDMIRVQVLKKDEKTILAGVKIQYAEDFRLYKDQVYYYDDYVVLYEPGYYILQIFSKDQMDKPLAVSDFYVRN